MNRDPQFSKSPMWDWPFWIKGSMPNPLDVFAAPQNLVQPILPGWVLGGIINVTAQNSKAPDTEREIVAMHSYGRQIGRIMDALAALISELPKEKQAANAFKELLDLHRDIDEIKAQAAARRLDLVADDLATLRAANREEYDRVVAKLREALREAQ